MYDKLIVSNYLAVSINNWLPDVSATKAFVSKICMQLMKAFVTKTSCNQLLIDTAMYNCS